MSGSDFPRPVGPFRTRAAAEAACASGYGERIPICNGRTLPPTLYATFGGALAGLGTLPLAHSAAGAGHQWGNTDPATTAGLACTYPWEFVFDVCNLGTTLDAVVRVRQIDGPAAAGGIGCAIEPASALGYRDVAVANWEPLVVELDANLAVSPVACPGCGGQAFTVLVTETPP